LALDLEGDILRAALCAPRGSRTVVTRAAVTSLGLPSTSFADPAAVGKGIAAALDKLRIKPVQTVMGVPRQLVVLRTLTVPLIEDVRELASVVHLQIGKDLPFRPEEAIIDFKVRGETAGAAASESSGEASKPAGGGKEPSPPVRQLDVLVAIIRRDTVEFFEKVAAAAQIKLMALGWLSEANARCVEACRAADVTGAVALVSLRPGEVAVDVVERGALLFSRGAGVRLRTEATGGDAAAKTEAEAANEPPAATDPATYVEAATIEVMRSLHSYGGIDSPAPVTTLRIAGGTGQEQPVLDVLRERLQLPGCLLEPAEALDMPKAAREHAADAVGAIGLGLGVNDPEGLPFDFLRPKRPAVQRNMRRIRTLALTTVGVVLLIGVLGVRSHLVKQREKAFKVVDAEVRQAEKKLPGYRKIQQQAAVVQAWTKEGRNWLEHLAYLSSVLPGSEDLYLTALSVSGQGNIHLSVQARSGEILANLDRQLRAAGYDVKPLAITPGNEKFGYNFRSTVELIIPAKMKIDLSKVQPPARPADDASLEGKSRTGGRKGGRS
jgi:Tfp pilus assembly PilM family ATPase